MLRKNPQYLLIFELIVLCALVFRSPIFVQSSQAMNRARESSSEENHPILVELFTSEGCSSCPPADEFLQKLDALQPVPGAELIVLSEHVDYWDHDGWKDPNSSHALTERQAAYVRALGLSTAYTPQMIVDGTREVRINDAQQVENVFEQAAAAAKIPLHVTVTFDPENQALLHAHVDAAASPQKADVFLALLLNRVDSHVLKGENGGRQLTHVAVVQQLIKIGKLQEGQGFSQDAQLQLKPGVNAHNIRVVVFAQQPGPGQLLGASLWKSQS